MEHTITIDFETRSAVDLKVHGRFNYMHDSSFKIVLMAVKYDNEPTKVYPFPTKELIASIVESAEMLGYNLVAHNAAFEIGACEAYGVDTGTNGKSSPWRDTMVMCAYYGLPISLDNASKYLNLKNAKLSIGRELIEYFTRPISDKVKARLGLPKDKMFWEPEDNLEKWLAFKEYVKYDVEACYEITTILPDIPEFVWDEWLLNLNINRRGILIDKNLCEVALKNIADEENECMVKLHEITGLDNPKSRTQLKQWFLEKFNLNIDSLNKEVIEKIISDTSVNEEIRVVLSLFSTISKTSTAKYKKFLDLMDDNNKIYDILNFYGARTGRWSSWGVQIHNMKRISVHNYKELRELALSNMLPMMYDNLSDIYSQLIRTSILAHKDKYLVIADFSQIEARVLQWLAGNQTAIDIFKSGKDYYTFTAALMFNKNYNDIPKDSDERRKGKIASLLLGYGGGVAALDRGSSGSDLSEEEKLRLVRLWRRANPKVVAFWNNVNSAFIKCLISKQDVALKVAELAGVKTTYSLTFKYSNLLGKNNVCVELPSGRTLWYPDVCNKGRDYVFYGKSSDDQFTETYTKIYGGFLVENITQAIARDCLQGFINKLTSKGLPVVFHVHDEVICEVNKADVDNNHLIEDVLTLSKQTTFEGLPVVAEPKASEYYDK